MSAGGDSAVRRFLLEALDIRGALVRLESVWQELLAGRAYPAPVRALLGQTTAVTVLIAAQLKQPGRLGFQVQGHGPVSLLLVDCSAQLGVRGMARHGVIGAAGTLPELLGDGTLQLSLETADAAQPWRSIVPLAGASVAAVFEHYLTQSEQQPARLWLAADERCAAGLFLQCLPGAAARDADGWARIETLAATLTPAELLGLDAAELLRRLFAQEAVRLFDARAVHYDCPEDRDKVVRMLRGLGRATLEEILREHGEVLIEDEVCNRRYRFDAADIAALFAAPAPPGLH